MIEYIIYHTPKKDNTTYNSILSQETNGYFVAFHD